MKNNTARRCVISILLLVASVSTVCMANTNNEELTLGNSRIQVRINPANGRIMSFARQGEASLLWRADSKQISYWKKNNKWVNYGGDKVWPSQQVQWRFSNARNWPPAPYIDCDNWTVIARKPEKTVIQSPVSLHLGITVKRTITVLKDLPGIEICNTITRVKSNPFPVHIWSITQVKQPEYFLLNNCGNKKIGCNPFLKITNQGEQFPEKAIEDLKTASTIYFNNNLLGEGEKIATFGNWMATVYHNNLFVQISKLKIDGCYPDGGNLEVFVNAPKEFGNYSEMEILSDNRHLKEGETMSNKVIWLLLDKSPQDSHSDVIDKIKTYISQVVFDIKE